MPLIHGTTFISTPGLLMPDLLGERRFANPYLANFPRLTRSNLITATDLLKDKGLKAFAKKVVKKLIGRA